MRQHTLGHLDCPACEETKQAIMFGERYASYLFPEAAQMWLDSRRQLSQRTRRYYQDYIKSLARFFGLMRLRDIHIGHVVIYQRSRQEQIRTSAQHRAAKRVGGREPSDGASRINHEISCLGQIMARAGLWDGIKKFYEPLPLPRRSIAIALTPEEDAQLFRPELARGKRLVAYCCDLLSRATTASPAEIRYLRLRQIELDGPQGDFIHIEEGVKNEFRIRPVPLNRDARWAIEQLLQRFRRMCARHGIAADPEHFLLWHRADQRGGRPDPMRPMSSWKKGHYSLRREAAKHFPRLAQLRRYDLRHTACTDMLENPAISYSTIEHMMGHRLASNTKRRYDHRRNAALRAAAEALERNHARPAAPVAIAKAKAAAG